MSKSSAQSARRAAGTPLDPAARRCDELARPRRLRRARPWRARADRPLVGQAQGGCVAVRAAAATPDAGPGPALLGDDGDARRGHRLADARVGRGAAPCARARPRRAAAGLWLDAAAAAAAPSASPAAAAAPCPNRSCCRSRRSARSRGSARARGRPFRMAATSEGPSTSGVRPGPAAPGAAASSTRCQPARRARASRHRPKRAVRRPAKVGRALGCAPQPARLRATAAARRLLAAGRVLLVLSTVPVYRGEL